MSYVQPFSMVTRAHPLLDGCAVCDYRVRDTAYWDVNGLPVAVMTASMTRLDEMMIGGNPHDERLTRRMPSAGRMVHGYRQADLQLRIDPAPQVRRRGPETPAGMLGLRLSPA